MSEVSPLLPESARKVHVVMLRRLAERGQANIGETIGKSETWVSRWKSDDSENFARVLDALGLKVVDSEARCYAPDYLDHLRYFARAGFDAAPELDEEPE